MWRHTLFNEILPFKSFNLLEQEQEKKKLNKFNPYGEDATYKQPWKSDINPTQSKTLVVKETGQKFALRATLYSKSRDSYVQIKQFEAKSQNYVCRIVGSEQTEDVTLPQQDLT